MIFDVARHKFSEGLLTLLLFAVMAVATALSMSDIAAMEGGAPLRGFIDNLSLSYPIASALAMLLLVVYAGLRYSRAAVRVGIYSASSLAPVALSGGVIFATVSAPDYLSLMVVVLLLSEVLGRLLYCFGASMRMSFLFTAMLALGTMPLIDGALMPLVLALPLIVIVMRGTLREAIITVVGVALPTFVYCYVVWLLGGEFNAAFADVWSLGNAVVQHAAVVEYLTIPRLVFLGVTLFVTVCSIILFWNVRVTLVDSVRAVWRLLITLQIMLVALLLLTPFASPAVVVALLLVMTMMMPQLFIRVDVYTATIVYLIWVVSALATTI